LPFAASDALGIIHQHIAGIPVTPHHLDLDIPQTVSSIIMKLLAKMADDRYQNAWGLKADLDRCLQELRNGVISNFEPGTQDFSDCLRMPQKLYGRDSEMNTLLDAFKRTYAGEKELLLVAGYAGVGKTRLVRELQRIVLEKQGYFIESKFEQLQRAVPYWGWIQAFAMQVNYLLMENEANIDQWKRRILNAVGNIGKVLTDVIPNLELIIGSQPDIPELGGRETQNRFNYIFTEFVKTICSKEFPLIIFLDDLQWIDTSSLKLLQVLLTDSTVTNLMVIGAYRDNEVDTLHPLTKGIEAIRRENANVELLTVRELTEATTNTFIADILYSSPAQTAALTRLVYSKTGGNPFFVIQTLLRLVETNAITFNKENHIWFWDDSVIGKIEITDNVVDLMVGKIRQLDPDAQRLLPLAACVGFQFRVSQLSIVSKQTEEEILEGLQPALREGLIVAVPEKYQFVHDRVQQAAYTLIPDLEKKKVHLEIGRLLFGNLPYGDHEELLFTFVDHMNIGAQLIENADERLELARLNLRAGHKARDSGALSASAHYFEAGLKSLGKESWANYYDLTLELHTLAAETESLSGNFGRVEELFVIVTRNALSAIDTVGVYESMMNYFLSQGLLQEVINASLEILDKLGLDLLPNPTDEDISREMKEIKKLYAEIPIESLVNLPLMRDPGKLAILRVLIKVATTTFSSQPSLCQMIILTEVRICITYGNSMYAPYCFASYALACVSHGDLDTGYRFGKLAMTLLEGTNNSLQRSKTSFVVNGIVWHSKQHLRTTLPGLEAGYQSGLETGDLEYATINILLYCEHSFFAGVELHQFENVMASTDAGLHRIQG